MASSQVSLAGNHHIGTFLEAGKVVGDRGANAPAGWEPETCVCQDRITVCGQNMFPS